MTDDELIEAMARAMFKDDQVNRLDIAKAALAVARPIIAAQERERCAVQADAYHSLQFDMTVSDEFAAGFFTACNDIAAAIRETGDE